MVFRVLGFKVILEEKNNFFPRTELFCLHTKFYRILELNDKFAKLAGFKVSVLYFDVEFVETEIPPQKPVHW